MDLLCIDASGFLHRYFRGMAPIERSDGQQTGAVHGFCQMLWHRLRKANPTHIVVVFDAPGKKKRHAIYSKYKANRKPLEVELTSQFPLARIAVDAFGIPRIEVAQHEADDVIATAACQATARGGSATIISSDKDFFQLLRLPSVRQWCPLKRDWITREHVISKLGVGPELAIDAQALIGDSADNVPGIHGIGVGYAAALLKRFGSLDAVLANAHLAPTAALRTALADVSNVESALLSRDLVALQHNVPGVDIDQFEARPFDPEKLLEFLQKMEFVTLSREVRAAFHEEAA